MSEPAREQLSRRNLGLFAVSCFLLGLAGSFFYFDWQSHRDGKGGRSVHETAGIVPTATSAAPDSGRSDAAETVDDVTESRRNALVQAAEVASPSVVSLVVYTPSWMTASSHDLFDELFSIPSPGKTVRPGLTASIGSGFIVDESGVILTNEHVVRNGEQILVNLTDGRTVEAQLVGADTAYDLAVLKMDPGDVALPTARIGDSDDLMVGEWSIAIGNPFGSYLYDKQHTVTVGVISALHRDVKDTSGRQSVYQPIYKDMIQTDAAINPGNSGGPLVNGLGSVIGVNTFIFTQGGGSLGIGFAIPINTAVRAAREIIQFGRVRHVNLGIYVEPISAAYAATMRVANRRGLVVRQLDAGSPGAEAGLQLADIIRAIDGTPVTSVFEARRKIFGVQVEIPALHDRAVGRHAEIPVCATADDLEGRRGMIPRYTREPMRSRFQIRDASRSGWRSSSRTCRRWKTPESHRPR
ncbi:MAG: trypsin-like peptidase domain-containing protein [Candidatus Eisenbacteria bacterium]